MTRRTMTMLATGAVLATAGVAVAEVTSWTSFFSEEGQNWRQCDVNSGVQAMQASGNFSDNLALGCTPWTFGDLQSDPDSSGSYWSPAFSEEGNSGVDLTKCEPFLDGRDQCDTLPTGSNFHACFGGFGAANKGVVTGMACYGSHCDKLSIHCQKPVAGRLGNCFWSDPFSDEQQLVDFGPDRYITGVQCAGRYCDRMSFYVCTAQP
jgi:hypothetical protein